MGPGKGQEDLQSHRSGVRKCKRTWSAASADSRFLRSWSSAACALQTHRVRAQTAETGARHGSSPSLGGAAQAAFPVVAPCPAREAHARGVVNSTVSAHLLPSLSRLLRRSERRDSSLRRVEIVSAADASPLRASCAKRAPPPSDAGEEEPIRPPCCTSRACHAAGPPTRVTNELCARRGQGITLLLRWARCCCCMTHRDESPAGHAAGSLLTCCPSAIKRDNPFMMPRGRFRWK